MRRLFGIVVALFLLSATAGAMVIEGGAAVWVKQLDGWVEYKGSHVDLRDDLTAGTLKSPYYWIRFEHPIPFIPNVKLEYAPFDMYSDNVISRTFTFGDYVYSAGMDVESRLKADQLDAILYFNPLPWIAEKLTSVKVSVGVDAKYIDGYVKLKGKSGSVEHTEDKDFRVVVPMLYGRVEVSPLNLVYLEAEGKYVGYGGNQFYDLYVGTRIKWQLLFVMAGYRYEALQLDDISDVSSNVKIKGWVFGVGLQF